MTKITTKVLDACLKDIQAMYQENRKEFSHYGASMLTGLNYNIELVKKGYQCDLPLVRAYVFKKCGKGDNNEE